MTRNLWGAAALITVTALTVSSCQLLRLPGPAEPSATETADPVPVPSDDAWGPEDSPVYDQVLQWTACGDFECADAQVPLDWSDPAGPTITIALTRSTAKKPQHKVGSLLINPGGPGGSGVDLLDYFVAIAGQKVLDSYDIVGFDPRGVAASTPITCGTDADVDAFIITDLPTVATQADLDVAIAHSENFARLCHRDTGAALENVDTASAARDMDVLRAVLGDSTLNFLGFSYGTQLGATYAELYPGRVGRMVLDGAVDFLIPGEDQALEQAAGFEVALTHFLEWCATRRTCSLSPDVETARAEVLQIALTARDATYRTTKGKVVNGNLMAYGIIVTLYDEGSWEYLQMALAEVQSLGTADIFYELANFYLDRDPVTGVYLSNSTIAFPAISCLDAAGEDWTLQDQLDYAAAVQEASPTFGWWFASPGSCAGWPWTAKETITSLDNARDAAPMLVIGTTGDPATPFHWAQSLAAHLGAPLLTYEGEGHTAYGRSNQCVMDVVDAYLVNGVVPKDGVTC